MDHSDPGQDRPSGAYVNNSDNSSNNHQWAMPPRPTQDEDYDADAEVVKPYAVEEPDDEPTHEPHRPAVSSLPDSFERWHIDLIDSMDDLQSEPDKGDSTFSSEHRRGQKRKPRTSAASSFQPVHSPSPPAESNHRDSQYETPGLTRKRPRRRNRKSGDGRDTATGSSTTSNGSESCLSSSSGRMSIEASGTETGKMNSDSAADRMDVD